MDEQTLDCSDERIVQMLYQKLGRPALAKTMGIVGSSAAEEIVQDVFTKLWLNKMKFPDIKRAYAWVYKCCTNASIDYLRNHNNTHNPLSETLESTHQDIEKQTQAKEVWNLMIKHLSQDELELFVYRELEGLNQDEVAEVMDISRRTVNRLQEKLDLKIEKIRRLRSE